MQVHSLISSISSDFTFYPLVTGLVHWCAISPPRRAYSPAAISAHWTYHTHCNLLPGTYFHLWVKWSIWGLSAFPRTHHRNYVPRLRGEKQDISLTILHQAGFETAWQAAKLAKSCFIVLNRGNKPIGLAWVPPPQKREAWNAIIVGLVYSGPPITHLCKRSTKDTRLANIETKLYSRLDAGVLS